MIKLEIKISDFIIKGFPIGKVHNITTFYY